MQRVANIQKKRTILNLAGSVNLRENKLKGEHSLIFETTEHEAKVSWKTVLQQKEDELVDFVSGKTDVNYLSFETVYFNVFLPQYSFAVTFLEERLLLLSGHPAALMLPFHCPSTCLSCFQPPLTPSLHKFLPPIYGFTLWLLISSITTGPSLLKARIW